jgi:exonuclease SbcC
VRLELEGFSSYRDKTVIDLSDADYFVLVGPTGSGKSTVIDGLCFALYGSVPRYEHKGLVAPVISQGLLQARVRLDFELGGRTYTAVRVVRRSGAGATTKEARLELEGEVVAGNADEVSAKVAELIGLSFDHFTKCVVLPQGEFSRFLHDRPKDRQDMVVRLLNLGVYEEMRAAASARANAAKVVLEVIEHRLRKDFEAATPEALAEAGERADRLAALRDELHAIIPKLQELEAQAEGADRSATEGRAWMTALEGLSVPAHAAALAGEIDAAEKEHEARRKAAAAAAGEVETALATRSALGARDPVMEVLNAHRSRTALEDKIRSARTELEETIAQETDIRERRDAARNAHAAALELLHAARNEHLAQHLARGLREGEPCPVCLQRVTKAPARAAEPDLDAAEQAAASAAAALEAAEERCSEAGMQRAGAQARVESLEAQIAELDAFLDERPDIEVLEKTLADIESADAAVDDCRAGADEARAKADLTAATLESLRLRAKDAWVEFDAQRDRVAALHPPPATKDDLATAWDALLAWAARRIHELEAAVAEADARSAQALLERRSLLEMLEGSCRECDVDVSGGRIEDAVISAFTQARADHAAIARALEEKATLESELAATRHNHAVASELALHLSAKPGRFESWIVNEALHRLVEGATEIMRELSGGQYSMTLDSSGNFFVTDHHNADEMRSARTLSGGETFLASLALALALSDQLAELAAQGAARLDAIFLDEGFGTLDPGTLDTVAATVENLAASGRMVGVVTHVRELAEQIPLQLRVHKDDRGSRIEMVSA